MPLDLSGHPNPDSPELAAFKQKVREVAKKYTDRHGWCGEVDRALREMGIRPEPNLQITVSTTLGFDVDLVVTPSMLAGLDEAAQKAKVCTVLGPLSIAGNLRANGSIRLTPEQISDLNLKTTTRNDGGAWLYTSNEGRVKHYFIVPESTGRYNVVDAVCGQSTTRNDLTALSTRGEDRHCAKCEERLPRRRLRVDTILAA